MTRDEVELVPEKVTSGEISWEQASRDLIVFVLRNKPLFALSRYDEDFISDLIIEFLDRSIKSFQFYTKEYGSFFSYLYTLVKNLCSSLVKKKALKNIIDYHNISECINNYENEVEAYQNIRYADFDMPKVPYRYTPISYKDFQIACKTDSYHIKQIISSEKNSFASEIKQKLSDFSPIMIQNIIMVLALKSSYYITEEQIEAITGLFNIDNDKFHQIVQELKKEMETRIEHKNMMEQRRNKAYFNHKRLKSQIEWNEINDDTPEYKNYTLKKQYNKNTQNWNILNHQLEEGKIMIRPTTKIIAKVLGLSTRQVTYYQSTARKLGIKLYKV